MRKLYASCSTKNVVLQKRYRKKFKRLNLESFIDVASYCYIVWVLTGVDITRLKTLHKWASSYIYNRLEDFVKQNNVGETINARSYNSLPPCIIGEDDFLESISLCEFYEMMDFFGACSEFGLYLVLV